MDPGKERRDLKACKREEGFSRSEEMVVSLMIHHPELIPTVSDEGILRDFEKPEAETDGRGPGGSFSSKRESSTCHEALETDRGRSEGEVLRIRFS